MRKNQVNMYFLEQTKRRNKIIGYCFCIVLLLALSFLSIYAFLNGSKAQYVKYKENSDLDYRVYLKENEFFDKEYLEKDKQYITGLIDYINVAFKYDLEAEELDINYAYSYKITADINVKEKSTKKSLYSYSEVLEEETKKSNTNPKVKINKTFNIDYNKYNNLIEKFLTVYDLDNADSYLTVNMYVNVEGNCEEVENSDTYSVISLTIPLSTKTIGLDINYNVIGDDNEKIMICTEENKGLLFFLAISIILLLIAIYLSIRIISFALKTRSAESIYSKELKSILNNYKNYIQKVNENTIDLKKYQRLEVDSFIDLLEIRDTILQPILMIENQKELGVCFVILDTTNLIYIYKLQVRDIKSKIEEKNNEKK